MGHPRGGHPRAPGAAEPRADAAPPRHPGLRAGADRGQGDPAAPARLHRVQRRLRRRPDGRARAAVARGPARGARADAVLEQHPVARERRPDHRAVAGRRARALLPDARARRREGRGHDLHRRARGAPRPRDARGRPARRREGPHRRVDQERRGRAQGEAPAGEDHRRARAPLGAAAARPPVRAGQPGHDQEARAGGHQLLLPRARPEGDRDLRRPADVHRLLVRDPRGDLDRRGRHDGAAAEVEDPRHGREGSEGDPGPVRVRPRHQRRALQQGRRHLVAHQRPDRQGDDGPAALRGGHRPQGPQGPAGLVQLHLHDGRLRRARLRGADPPARRHARPDGEAGRLDHRDADHRELPRGPERPAVLHLDPRRPQGPRGHRAEDRQLRLPDAPPRGRRPGPRRHAQGLRHRRGASK